MSVDFPNEAARCQRFLSGPAQSNFDAQGRPDLSLAAPEAIPLPGRPTCLIGNIQRNEPTFASQVHQSVRETTPFHRQSS